MSFMRRNPGSVAAVLLFALGLLGQTLYCSMRPRSTLDTLVYVSLLNGSNQQALRQASVSCAFQLPGPHNGCYSGRSPGFRMVAAFSPQRLFRVSSLLQGKTSLPGVHLGIAPLVPRRRLYGVPAGFLDFVSSPWTYFGAMVRRTSSRAACLPVRLSDRQSASGDRFGQVSVAGCALCRAAAGRHLCRPLPDA